MPISVDQTVTLARLSLLVCFFAATLSDCLSFYCSAAETPVDFNTQIRPILSGRCMFCHGPDEEERAAGLRLDTREGATEDLGGYSAVAPGDADASELIERLTTDDEDIRMPPADKGAALTLDEISLLRRWIEEGANYAKHWAYELPVTHTPPAADETFVNWPRNEIDSFVLHAMLSHGLKPSPQADRLTLARRVSLDLTGLPPTWERAIEFADNESPDAYEAYVDELLASDAFGERWARVWLDLARYADSAGYADDPLRTIWPYRDYVIKSFNRNLPFDQFTIEQIAGDLLESPTNDQLTATAFHRNTLTNNEGGTNDEEFRNVAVVDRVNTTLAVWMGTTMACAQCHTHKFDPITHDDYFSVFAIFNQSQDADKRDESPFIEVWTDDAQHKRDELQSKIDALQITLDSDTDAIAADRERWLAELKTPPQWRGLPAASASASKRTLTVEADGSISAADESGDKPDNDVYQVDLPITASDGSADSAITALRIEIPAEQVANFVLSQVNASFQPTRQGSLPAKYVRVSVPGKKKFLHIAEIQAFAGETNVAVSGRATQSSTYPGGDAAHAIDGQTDGNFHNQSVTHTQGEDTPWIEIELAEAKAIDRLVVWNRTDGTSEIRERIRGFELQLLDASRNVLWKHSPPAVPQPSGDYRVDGKVEIQIAAALADYEQPGFPAESALAAKLDKAKGWAVGGQTGKPHELTLVLAQPVGSVAGNLRLTLKQQSKHQRHLIDRVSVSTTSNTAVRQWAEIPPAIRGLAQKVAETLTPDQQTRLADFHRSITTVLAPQRKSQMDLQTQISAFKPPTVPIMRDVSADEARETFIQIRGNYLARGDKVTAGVPDAFHPLQPGGTADRLGLAHWLVADDNPLTARVIVNRYWEQLFGIGIVKTSEEFGAQGELPTHPELLDTLAVDLQAGGWDTKRLVKKIVSSATYMQSSAASPDVIELDPVNRYLSRGPRHRISAEMIRDQALFVGGLLSEKMYGPPVNPPQPSLGLKAAFGSATDWKTSVGEDRYRRGIYTLWRRSSPYPSMAAFDAPNREVCTITRGRTNTPLQALVTLNDPVYVEAAQSLARRVIADSSDEAVQLRGAFRACLIREPSDDEFQRLVALNHSATQHYQTRAADAALMAEDPLGALPAGADAIQHAAMTVVCNVLLNLDETFLKR